MHVVSKEKSTKLTSTDGRLMRLEEQAALRKDGIFKQLKLIPETEKFCVHLDNAVIRLSYTLEKT